MLLLIVAVKVHGQSSSAITELDPTVAIALELSEKVRLDLYAGREKSEEVDSAKGKVGAGISFRMKPVFRRFLDSFDKDKQHLLVLAATYEYSIANEAEVRSVEKKLMLDATLRYALPRDLLLSNRNRSEFRWVNGDYHFRYRNRPMLERPFRIRTREITPYIAAEAVWDQRYRKWNVFKFSTGLVVPLVRRVSLEFLYERQHCVTCSVANTNIFGLALNTSFKLKKR